jgi:glyoxylase I family protein
MTERPWQVKSLFHININCSNLERSVAFYEAFGFRKVLELNVHTEQPGGNDRAVGIDGPTEARGPVLMFLGDDPYQTRLDLLEWIEPAPAPHTPLQVQDVGIPRFALRTKNIDALHAELSTQGIDFMTEPLGPFPDWEIERMVCARDPDGLIVELLEFTRTGRNFYRDRNAD